MFTGRAMMLLAAVAVASALSLAGGQQASATELGERIRAQVERALERATAQALEARKTAAEATEDDGSRLGDGQRSGEAVLEVAGEPGTGFSGTCTAGEEENDIGGQTPRTYTYELRDGQKLDCEIRNEGGGELRILFDAGDTHSVQSFGPREGVVELVYDGDGVLVASSSSGSSGQTVVSSSSYSQVVSSGG